MIHVPRPAHGPPQVLAALESVNQKTGVTELAAARAYYKQQPKPKKAFPFARYKAFDVCVWLDAMFHEKCAYCESDYRAVDSRDVEHYRPKGGVTGADTHPGYWWLAGAWTNLLPSCPPCNQLRRQSMFKFGMTFEQLDKLREQAPTGKSGKANEFPMRPPAKWVSSERGKLSKEDPLLINPSERDPSQHLEWVFDWDRNQARLWTADPLFVGVRPRKVAGVDDPYGHASIAVYGLQRDGLVRTRMARAKLLQRDASIVVRSMLQLGEAAAPTPALQAQLDGDWKHLESYADKDQPYAAMAAAFIALFKDEVAAFLRP